MSPIRLASMWEDARANGRDISLDELCLDHPGLKAQISAKLKVLSDEDRIVDISAETVVPHSNIGRDTVAVHPAKFSDEPFRHFKSYGYQIIDELGRGGMGVVYLARHIETGDSVALKTLQQMTASGLYRFKKEFRVVSGISHKNLISLRELISNRETTFFVMEYLEGSDLKTHFGFDSPSGSAAELNEDATILSPDFQHLRAILGQLAEGMTVLHDAGVLHRDIKPSNVFVTPDGRVVLLDFGLAGELKSGDLYETLPGQIAGTIAYMAPEQAMGSPLSPAADWYAFGVLLYELLTARLPFVGTPSAILREKRRGQPEPPSSFRDVPADLEQLCLELLRLDPTSRPTSSAIRKAIGETDSSASVAQFRYSRSHGQLFGRSKELEVLDQAFSSVRDGTAGLVRVEGASGSGKSTLARAFCGQVETNHDCVLLTGQCYEQEQIPFKAFDEIVDSLSRYLVTLPYIEAAALCPRNISTLVRLFPVLRQVAAFDLTSASRDVSPDPQEMRIRGLRALRELLVRIRSCWQCSTN